MPPARAHLRLPAGLPRRRRPRDVRDGRLPADGLGGVAARARLHRRPLPQQGGEVRAAAGRQDAAAQGSRLHDLLPRRGAAPHHHTRNFLLEYSGTPPLAPQVACTVSVRLGRPCPVLPQLQLGARLQPNASRRSIHRSHLWLWTGARPAAANDSNRLRARHQENPRAGRASAPRNHSKSHVTPTHAPTVK